MIDGYSFRARLQPALITLLPTGLAAFAWLKPELGWISAAWSAFGTCGLSFLLAMWVREHGHRVQPKLWKEWGGAPTTQMLRHRGPANEHLRQRWHLALAKLMGKPFPTAEEEAKSHSDADSLYEAATKVLIDQTRNKVAFARVYAELVNYGFCRNLFSLKPFGIIISLVCTAACAWAAVLANKTGTSMQPSLVAGILCLALFGCWLVIIRSGLVRIQAFTYAEHLLRATEKMAAPPTSPAP